MNKKTIKASVFILVIFLVIAVLYSIFTKENNNLVNQSEVSIDKSNKEKVIVEVSKKIISSHLKSPGSAQFVEIVAKSRFKSNDTYLVFGDVDSQNGFGSLLRSHFFLEIIDKGGDKENVNNWIVNQLDLGDYIIISSGEVYETPLSFSDLSIEAQNATKEIEALYRIHGTIN